MTGDNNGGNAPITGQAPGHKDGLLEQDRSFIVRVGLIVRPSGETAKVLFSLEDVSANTITRHTDLNELTDNLSDHIRQFIANPVLPQRS